VNSVLNQLVVDGNKNMFTNAKLVINNVRFELLIVAEYDGQDIVQVVAVDVLRRTVKMTFKIVSEINCRQLFVP